MEVVREDARYLPTVDVNVKVAVKFSRALVQMGAAQSRRVSSESVRAHLVSTVRESAN
jgi:hypothetical protein